MTRRQKRIEVWDVGHFALVSLWRSSAYLFPLRLHLRSRPVKASPDVAEIAAAFGHEPVAFFSALLSCGHVVRAPVEFVMRPSWKPGRRPFVPCYKCWAKEGGIVSDLGCSFCGVPHDPRIPCMRPHEG